MTRTDVHVKKEELTDEERQRLLEQVDGDDGGA
jgi:hypothetical protein